MGGRRKVRVGDACWIPSGGKIMAGEVLEIEKGIVVGFGFGDVVFSTRDLPWVSYIEREKVSPMIREIFGMTFKNIREMRDVGSLYVSDEQMGDAQFSRSDGREILDRIRNDVPPITTLSPAVNT